MDWTTLVVALIVIGGWIAGNLKEIKKAAEKAAPPPPLPPPEPEAPAAFGRADDLQEFLKQIRRRAGENEPQPAAEPLPAVLVEATPRFEPSRVEPPPVVPPPKPKKKNRPASTSKPSRQKVDSPLMPAGLVAPSPPLAPDLPQASNRPKARSVDVREAVRLLKSPSGMKTAVILREILSEPLSKRRRTR